ncbi:MAG: hypothetical protein RSD57_07075 [Comamonas sp.]
MPSLTALRHSSHSRIFTAPLLAAGLVFASISQATPLAGVQLVERNSGQRLPIYQHQGEYWVAGRPGANYAIDITNHTGRRILAVISIDGVNVLNGQTASAAPDVGYVFTPHQNGSITGWRKSQAQVAAFYFSESEASYASRTGRSRDVGVIGVALFRERMPEPVLPMPPVTRRSQPQDDRPGNAAHKSTADSTPQAGTLPAPIAPSAATAPAVPASPATESAAPAAADIAMESEAITKPNSKRVPAAQADKTTSMAARSPSLGTGHGALESSHSRTTSFDSASQQPEQIVRIRYDSYANLVAKGVIRASRPAREHSPNAFPADPQRGYVPDPPRY